MLRKVLLAGAAVLVLAGAAVPTGAQTAPASAAASTAWRDGLFGVRQDARKGKISVRLPAPGADGVLGRYLYQPGLSAGLGLDGAGLDRSGLGQAQIVVFRKVGNRVFAAFENTTREIRLIPATSVTEYIMQMSFGPT